jgi:hypothetical protein
MSAYIVSDNHINVLVSYFVGRNPHDGLWVEIYGTYQYMNRDNATEVARILYAQNVRSVDVRYGEENPAYYSFRFISQAKDVYAVAEIAGLIDCLEYQSCETRDYYATDAYRILCVMRKELLNELQEALPARLWGLIDVRSSRTAA